MRPDEHLFYGLIFSFLLLLLFPSIGKVGFFIIFISTVLIDADHFLYYVMRKKDFNPKKALLWYTKNWQKFSLFSPEQKKEVYGGLYIFHGIEILIILLILGIFVSKYFLFIFLGFFFHLFLDLYMEIKLKERTDKLFLINDIFNFKKLKHIDEI